MKIAENSVVSIEYTVTDRDGTVLDTSHGQEPLTYIQGQGQIVAGLEKTLAGRAKGDSFKVEVPPSEGYGERDDDRILQVPRKELPKGMKPTVGMQIFAESPEGQTVPLWITDVGETEVTLDGNHPLSGMQLFFAVEVKEVRTATKEELQHGHVHGPGGHHHH